MEDGNTQWNPASDSSVATDSPVTPGNDATESLGNEDIDFAEAEAEAEERVTNNDVEPETVGAPELEKEQTHADEDRAEHNWDETPSNNVGIPLTRSDDEADPEISLDSLVDPVIVCMRMSKPFVFRMECEIDEIIYPPATLALEEFRLHFQGLDVDLLQALKA